MFVVIFRPFRHHSIRTKKRSDTRTIADPSTAYVPGLASLPGPRWKWVVDWATAWRPLTHGSLLRQV